MILADAEKFVSVLNTRPVTRTLAPVKFPTFARYQADRAGQANFMVRRAPSPMSARFNGDRFGACDTIDVDKRGRRRGGRP